MLHEQETWLAANRAEIQTKIAEGYASEQRGEIDRPRRGASQAGRSETHTLQSLAGLMETYQLTPEPVSDLLETCDFISQDNPEAADRVEDAVLRACDLLASSPLAGRARKDLTPLPLRFWVVQPYSIYLIVYASEKKPLQIIRILHGARASVCVDVMLLWAHRIRSLVVPTGFSPRLLFPSATAEASFLL